MAHEIDPKLIQPKSKTLTYEKYLQVPELLNLQNRLAEPTAHDEMLFIIIHQVYELWFKQILHEVEACMLAVRNDELMEMLRATKRITRIQETLTSQVGILETMTPNDFNLFRERLNPASGFQSLQFRILEFRLGAKNPSYLNFFRADAAGLAKLEKVMGEPTLYDEVLHAMARRGIKIPKTVLERDTSKAHTSDDAVIDAFVTIYQNPKANYDLYLCAEALMDIDENFLLWRQRHVAMVERMIGARRGTGGSSGAAYLATTLSKRFFPEIWDVRNRLGGDYGK